MVESHGLHKVVMPKKGTEYSLIRVFNVLPFLLLIVIDNQFYSKFFIKKKPLQEVIIYC
jgi:hypothetical protein